MKSLIIDTSTECAILAVTEGKNILYQADLCGGPALSKCLGLEVKKVLESCPLPYDRVVVGVGPGSFTGIRVGVAMAQALAFGWNIPLYTVSSMTGYALDAPTFAIAVDARSGGIYVQKDFGPATLIPRLETAQYLSKFPLISSPHPEKLPPLEGLVKTRPNPLFLAEHAVFSEKPDLDYLSSLEEKNRIP